MRNVTMTEMDGKSDLNIDSNQIVALMSPEELEEVTRVIGNLSEDGQVTEWGCGGSTVAWLSAMRPNKKQKLISVEHVADWYNKIDAFVKGHGLAEGIDFSFNYAPVETLIQTLGGESIKHEHVYSAFSEENPIGLSEYMLPTTGILNSDVFFIDGIGRGTIALMMYAFAKKDTAVFYLHDYVGREFWYDWVVGRIPCRKICGRTMLKFARNEEALNS